MSTATGELTAPDHAYPAAHPVVDVVIPVFNEQRDLEPSVRRLHAYLSETFPYPFRISIVDNASTDATLEVAYRLARVLPGVVALHLPVKGRGHALRVAWSRSTAPVLAYMDVDLSTDLAGFLPLVAPLISGHSEVAIGTRLGAGARVQRGLKREFISRCYNLILRTALRARFSDAQCGFKAIRHDAAACLLPMVEDGSWFFDTELLVLAQRCGMRIHEVPVDWVDDPDSRVDIVPTAIADLKGVARLLRAPRLVRFAGVGVASTLVYLLLFALGRTFLGAQAANLVALLASALGNTATNRRFTFGVRGSTHAVRHHVQGLLLFLAGLALTGGALQLLTRLDPRAPGCRAHRTGGGQRRGHRDRAGRAAAELGGR
jgi:glycosyltransferase involved in cell wall biosynthesis